MASVFDIAFDDNASTAEFLARFVRRADPVRRSTTSGPRLAYFLLMVSLGSFWSHFLSTCCTKNSSSSVASVFWGGAASPEPAFRQLQFLLLFGSTVRASAWGFVAYPN